MARSMRILFFIALGIIIFGVINYDKMSYKATYFRNKKEDVGYYWGGVPRNEKTIKRDGEKYERDFI